MSSLPNTRRGLGLLVAALIGFAVSPALAQTPAGETSEDWQKKLSGLETAPDLDLAAIKQQAMDRVKAKSKEDAAPLKRAPIAPQLLKLPQVLIDIKFDEDAAVIKPESYRAVGRLADTLLSPPMLGYRFLIVGHTAPGNRRDAGLTLSQRRADVIRDVLVGTFKISGKRLQAIGLGEEQLLDSARPASPVNLQTQVMTVGEVPTEADKAKAAETPTHPKPAAPPHKKK
jgi:OOP family OmpA-OmpF porin